MTAQVIPPGPPKASGPMHDNATLCRLSYQLTQQVQPDNPPAQTTGQVRVISRYGTHNRRTNIAFSGHQGLAIISFNVADAKAQLAVSDDRLKAFTNALLWYQYKDGNPCGGAA